MKREYFREIKKEHIEFCKDLLLGKKRECNLCPLSSYNAVNDELCTRNGYAYANVRCVENGLAMESAKEFLELFERDFIEDKKTFEVSNDKINSPNHYKLEGLDIESIDVIFAVVRGINNGVIADCVGNILKYVMRAEKKNGLEDYKKARKYLDWCIEEKGKEEK